MSGSGIKEQFIRSVVSLLLLGSIGCDGGRADGIRGHRVPEWAAEGIFYEAYTGSLPGGGEFTALRKRLAEVKRMGVNVISLPPVCSTSELGYIGGHGGPCAVKDFYSLNPELGTPADFKSLVGAIHKEGMKVIVAFNLNYAAWDSRLIVQHPDWFVHNSQGAIISPSAEFSDAAQIDMGRHETRKYMIAMLKYWAAEYDIDGFVLSGTRPISPDYWNTVSSELKSIREFLLVSGDELPVSHIDAFDITCSWSVSNALNSVFCQDSSTTLLRDSLLAEFRSFPAGSLRMHFSSVYHNSDEKILGDGREPEYPPGTAVFLCFTMPGVPLVFSGDWKQVVKNRDAGKFIAKMCMLRREHKGLRRGFYKSLANDKNNSVFSFIRQVEEDTVVVVVNGKKRDIETCINMPAGVSSQWLDRLSGEKYDITDSLLDIILPPLGFSVLAPVHKRSDL